ncbi:MAG: ABC transporter ATP-binding protein [Thermodesulfobacteriota bacterium]
MLLEVDSLAKSFGRLRVLDRLSFNVKEGELKAIIGPNGAGKTTLFNVITGRYHSDGGRIRFRGKDVTGEKPHVLAGMGLARSFQINNFFFKLSVLENIRLSVQSTIKNRTSIWRDAFNQDSVKDRVDEIMEWVELRELANELARNLSYGDQRKLEIALALGTGPSLVMLDEPTSGMSRFESQSMIHLVKALSSRVTIVLIEHDIEFVMNVSDSIMVMHYGQKIAEGTPQEISGNQEVQDIYLGGL